MLGKLSIRTPPEMSNFLKVRISIVGDCVLVILSVIVSLAEWDVTVSTAAVNLMRVRR